LFALFWLTTQLRASSRTVICFFKVISNPRLHRRHQRFVSCRRIVAFGEMCARKPMFA